MSLQFFDIDFVEPILTNHITSCTEEWVVWSGKGDLVDDDEDLIVDTSDLEEDEDVSEVKEHIEIDDETH